IADALVDAGFDVICHATNHALDKGKKGILNTLSNWEEDYPDITVLGIYDNEADSEEIPLVSVNGITLAILNYTYGTNGIALPSDMPYCVELLDKEKVIADLEQAESLADFTIVCPHWGVEYSLTPSQDQENWCKLFLDHGADLVLGTHPHVIEPVTVMEDDAGHSMVVYYSLGNFVNWTSGTGAGVANRMVGGMADVTLERDKDGTVKVSDYGVIPLICHVRSGHDGVTVYPLGEYDETLGNENEIRSQDSAFSYDYCRELTESIWGEVVRK
nr:CapA family protein [Lachnospiraceae bacterium]